jgi:stage II sporulation protein D
VGLLVDVARVSIGADHGLVVRESKNGAALARATFLALGAGQAPRYRVQVASFTEERAARQAAQRARAASGLEPDVRWNGQTRTFQVRLGDLATREEAQALAARLEDEGVKGGWVVDEGASGAPGRVRLLETGEELASATLVAADAADLLSADGAPYRGYLEVRANPGGTLTTVNVLHVEDYLRGVVPNELSPSAFPQLEAVKAQAIAARTYALRNMGQFAARGYDICATPACQVYRGRASEQEMSDRAVEETRGLAALYGGSLINALYTSTCGGHTEDVENIFEGDPSPYLRGVVCLPEREAWTTVRTTTRPAALGDQERLARDAALLQSLGVLDDLSGAALGGFATPEDVGVWVRRLVEALGRRGCAGASDRDLARRGTFFRHLVGSLCWEERARRLLAPADPEYLLRVEDRASLRDGAERTAAALLIQEGILTPFPNNTLRPAAAITRADAVRLLAETAVRAGAPGLVSATFRNAREGSLTVERDGARESHALDGGLRLFRALNGSRLAASELGLASGDTVRFVLRDGRVVFLEAEQSRLGPSADHTSRYYRWEARLSPGEVATAVARYGRVGHVRDVKPLRLGVSGRVVEAAVVGSEGELLLKGLKVRWGLGLRENLFVVDRELDGNGGVSRFIFTGKGWGHGVGLCQVGAFGMAQSGSTFDRIVRHYYSGVAVDRRY